MRSNTRFEKGLEKLSEIDGRAGEEVISSLSEINPALARYTVEFGFGDIYSRSELDLRSREIATVAALTTLGHAQPQLKVHINAALNVGCTPREILEIITQMAVYAGFPAALNASFTAKEVFDERGIVALRAGCFVPTAQVSGRGHRLTFVSSKVSKTLLRAMSLYPYRLLQFSILLLAPLLRISTPPSSCAARRPASKASSSMRLSRPAWLLNHREEVNSP
ncbi:carboxymuconolactone decarboxylase family protein [Dongshaea marina]|uniref:carboxymuconolactone decarboxylase family protein n=1 Tax=Dongshaea marina TaxID=2047966 RepID=UPI000D3E2966